MEFSGVIIEQRYFITVLLKYIEARRKVLK